MPGDLVMAFASDINHPAVAAGLIHRHYILVGAVKSFVKVRWNTTLADDDWDGFMDQERLKVEWSDIKDWDNLSLEKPEYPLNSQVKVIALKSDSNLNGFNLEFEALIKNQFEFGRGGWVFKQYFH